MWEMIETASFLDSHPKLLFNIGSMWESYIGLAARDGDYGSHRNLWGATGSNVDASQGRCKPWVTWESMGGQEGQERKLSQDIWELGMLAFLPSPAGKGWVHLWPMPKVKSLWQTTFSCEIVLQMLDAKHHTTYMEVWEYDLVVHMSSKDWTQVIRIGGKSLTHSPSCHPSKM